MKFIIFLFRFLYTRNWVNGKLELSQARLILFLAMLGIIMLVIILAAILQSPVEYKIM